MKPFKETLLEKVKETDHELLACFDRKFDTPDIIVSAMKYSLFAGGKRLRPILMNKRTIQTRSGRRVCHTKYPVR